MALGDPFSAVMEANSRRDYINRQTLENFLGVLSKQQQQQDLNKYEEGKVNKQRQLSTDMLRQVGIITDTPLTINDYKKSVEEQTGKGGIEISSDLPEEKQLKYAEMLLKGTGLKPPTPKTTIDFNKAAELGIDYDPISGGLKFKPERPKGVSVADASDIPTNIQLQLREISRKRYGVRGAEFALPSLYQEYRNGKTPDQIDDEIRYSGQSKEFVGSVREATQTMMMGSDANKTQGVMDFIDDAVSRGDTEGIKSQLKRLAMKQAGTEESRSVVGKERTIKLLGEIQDDLNNLEAMGINTNIFTGTEEQMASKVGTVVNPEARKVATKIAAAIQNYRRSMTGVQFGMPENKEYKVMFPSIGRTANFNTANIDALKEVMKGDLDNFYSLSMGEGNYKKLFQDNIEGVGKQTSNQSKTSKFKAGDTQVKNGVTYKRDEVGQWHPQK